MYKIFVLIISYNNTIMDNVIIYLHYINIEEHERWKVSEEIIQPENNFRQVAFMVFVILMCS